MKITIGFNEINLGYNTRENERWLSYSGFWGAGIEHTVGTYFVDKGIIKFHAEHADKLNTFLMALDKKRLIDTPITVIWV